MLSIPLLHRTLALGVSSLLLGTLPATTHAVHGVYDYGIGQIARGTSGAGMANPQDAFTTLMNPAGLPWVNHRYDAGLAIEFPLTGSTVSQGTGGPLIVPKGDFTSQIKVFELPDLGALYHHDAQNHFGASLIAVGGFGTEYQTGKSAVILGTPERGFFGNGTALSSLKILSANGSYAYRVHPDLSFGVTLSYYLEAFESKGAGTLAPFSKTYLNGGNPSHVSNNGIDYASGLGGVLGVLYQATPYLKLGAAAQPKVHFTRLNRYRDLIAGDGHLDLPGKYSLGAYWQGHTLNYMLDLLHFRNKDVGIYGNNSEKLLNGACLNPANANSCLGGRNGPGFGWANQTVLKVAVEGPAYNKDTWRAGVSYGNRLAHAKDALINTLAPAAVVRWVFSAGYTHPTKDYSLHSFVIFFPKQTLQGPNPLGGQQITIKAAGVGAGMGASF
jgi:long-chain fatty acid transport protein